MTNEQLSTVLTCLCCGLPFAAGFVVAWIIRGIKFYGLGGLPSKLREFGQRYVDWMNEETDLGK